MNCDMYTIGGFLQEVRRDRKITQQQMADELDISLHHYAKIEQGNDGMSLELLFKIMTVLEVDANTLLMYGKTGSQRISFLTAQISCMDSLDQDEILCNLEMMIDTKNRTIQRRGVG